MGSRGESPESLSCKALWQALNSLCNNWLLAKDPANIYLFKVNNKNTRKRCEICSKLTIKTPVNVSWGVYFNIFTKEYILIYQSSNKIFNRMMTLPQLFYRPAVLKNFWNFMHLQHYLKNVSTTWFFPGNFGKILEKFFYIKSSLLLPPIFIMNY